MTLSSQLDSPLSPLRRWLDVRLPGAAKWMREEWRRQLVDPAPVMPPAGAPLDVLGHIIDKAIGWQHGSLLGPEEGLPGVGVMVDWLDFDRSVVRDLTVLARQPLLRGVVDDQAARAACLIGLIDRTYRSMEANEPWYSALRQHNLTAALSAVSPAWVDDVVAVAAAAATCLTPRPGAGVTVSPVFAGSIFVGGADGDLVVDELLVEVKAGLAVDLRQRDAYQVLAYALLDWDDRYQLRAIAILQARHGRLVRWPLEDLLRAVARDPGNATLPGARAHLREALGRRPDVDDDEDDDHEARGLDDDSGYGPDSNWSHTMSEDD